MGYAEGTNPVVLSSYQDTVRKLQQQALDLAEKDPKKAAVMLKQAILYEGKLASLAYGDTKKDHLARMQRLEAQLQRLVDGPPPPAKAGKGTRQRAKGEAPPEGELAQEEEEFLAWARTLRREGAVPWEKIAGNEEPKAMLIEAVNLFLAKRPAGVKVHGWSNILLFGPAGTGKTLLASALASRMNLTFFEASLHDLRSKWVGDSGKRLQAVFKVAAQEQPSVLFVDEMTELGRRGEEQHEVSKQLHDQFLIETDGLSKKLGETQVLLLGATNYPWELSEKVLSRFQHMIFVPLPSARAREEILRIHVEGDGHRSDVGLGDLAKQTEGYSGRELKDVAREAVMHMVRDLNPWMREPEAFKDAQREIKVRPLAREDFEAALARIKPKSQPADLKKLEAWAKQYASVGGRS